MRPIILRLVKILEKWNLVIEIRIEEERGTKSGGGEYLIFLKSLIFSSGCPTGDRPAIGWGLRVGR